MSYFLFVICRPEEGIYRSVEYDNVDRFTEVQQLLSTHFCAALQRQCETRIAKRRAES